MIYTHLNGIDTKNIVKYPYPTIVKTIDIRKS